MSNPSEPPASKGPVEPSSVRDDSLRGESARKEPVQRTAIAELSEGSSFSQPFRLADKQIRVNRQGSKYLLLKLSDRTGTIVAMMWNAEDSDFESLTRGGFVHCVGRTQVHQGALQIILTSISDTSDALIDLAEFDRFDSAAAEASLNEIRQILGSLRNVHLRELGKSFFENEDFVNRFRIASAAVSNHHAYPGGLLRHTLDLMQLCQLIGPRYAKLDVDRLTFGAFLHDLGKIEEISSEGDLSYTDRGQLVGHLVIGVEMLSDAIERYEHDSGTDFPRELRLHLEHMIVSHHGQLEFGSPRVPATLEAVALHHIDNLDAKLVWFDSLIDSDLTSDGNWTNYIPAIGRKLWKSS
ncbi:MAG: HD domain-containing protein [Planctomycetota bacterium]